jgi:hypothetical protein
LISTLFVIASSIPLQGKQPSVQSADTAGAVSSTQKELPKAKHKIGIFAFGSLIADPGAELAAATTSRLEAETPFAIEYDHTSTHTRGGAPTLVPVASGGAKVKATILVLKDPTSEQQAANLLWRRETRQIGSGKAYKRPVKPGPNSVLVAACKNFMGFDEVLYTDFPDSGKLTNPSATQLAELAVGSARNHDVPDGMDGISYLMSAEKAGIITPLTGDYEKEILRIADASSLGQALEKVRGAPLRKQTPLGTDVDGNNRKKNAVLQHAN